MSDKKSKKQSEDNRDIFEKVMDEPLAHAGLVGGAILGARLLGGKFGKGRVFKGQPGLNFGMRSLGMSAGGTVGVGTGIAADQHFKTGKYGKKGISRK